MGTIANYVYVHVHVINVRYYIALEFHKEVKYDIHCMITSKHRYIFHFDVNINWDVGSIWLMSPNAQGLSGPKMDLLQ